MALAPADLARWLEEQEGDPWLYHVLEDPSHLRHVLRDGLRSVEDRWAALDAHRDRCVYLWADGSAAAALRVDVRRLDLGALRVDEGHPLAAPQAFGPAWAAGPAEGERPGAWADGLGADDSRAVLASLRAGSVAHRGLIAGELLEVNPGAAPRTVPERFAPFLDLHADPTAAWAPAERRRLGRRDRAALAREEAIARGLRRA